MEVRRSALAEGTPLLPGDTVYFKGGVQYVFTESSQGGYTPGIQSSWSGSSAEPITYTSTNAWGDGTPAIITDSYAQGYGYAASWAYGGASNVVFNNLEFGPMGGSSSLPSYSDVSYTTITTGSMSTGTSPLSVHFGHMLPCSPCTGTGSSWSTNRIDNTSSNNVITTNLTIIGADYFSFDGTPPITNFPSGSGTIRVRTFASQTRRTVRFLHLAVILYCDNGQILTNVLIGQSAAVPNQGWGIFFASGVASNVTVENCYFHDLGYSFNQEPMSANSIQGDGLRRRVVGGIQVAGDGAGVNGLTITNCQFLGICNAVDINYEAPRTNLTVEYCDFSSGNVWGVSIAGQGGGSAVKQAEPRIHLQQHVSRLGLHLCSVLLGRIRRPTAP